MDFFIYSKLDLKCIINAIDYVFLTITIYYFEILIGLENTL